MPQRGHDPDEVDWYDDEDDDPADAFPCPECGADIFADLDCCPRCGYWLTDTDTRSRDPGLFQSRGVKIVAIVMLALFVLGLLADLMGTF